MTEKSGSGMGWKKKIEHWRDREIDQWKLALLGTGLAFLEKRFLVVFFLNFIGFGTLISLLSGGTATINLLLATGLMGKMAILKDGFFGLFGFRRYLGDWLLLITMAVLQSILIGLLALIWQKKRKERMERAEQAQNIGLVAGLAILGSGCPTCGTSLMMPILGSIFSSGSYALSGVLSGVVTGLAMVVGLATWQKLGFETYILIISEKRRKNGKEN